MRSIKTSSLVRRAVAVSLGLAFTASAAYAGDPGLAFSPSDTLTATRMNQLNSAVSDNNSRIGAVEGTVNNGTTGVGALNTTVSGHTTSINNLQTDVNNLKQNITTGSCGTGMTRVGPTCVDNTLQATTNSWEVAVNTCRDANKRLLTPAEYVAARNAGTISGMTVLEWVDAIAFKTSGTDFTMYAGAIGPGTSGGTAEKIEAFINYLYNGDVDSFQYRCAR
jgi:hypothetical protein